MEQPNQKPKVLNSYYDNETFEKFYQKHYKRLIENAELRAHKIEALIEEDSSENTQQYHTTSQNLCEQSTSTKQPDGAASEAATAKIQCEGTIPSSSLSEGNEDALGSENDMNGQCKQPDVAASVAETAEIQCEDSSENTQQYQTTSQNLYEQSTSTKQPDGAASVAATAEIQCEGTIPSSPLSEGNEDALGSENDMNGQCKQPDVAASVAETAEIQCEDSSENTQQYHTTSQNLCEQSTSTKQPDGAASEAATAKIQCEGTIPSSSLSEGNEDALGSENDMNGQCKQPDVAASVAETAEIQCEDNSENTQQYHTTSQNLYEQSTSTKQPDGAASVAATAEIQCEGTIPSSPLSEGNEDALGSENDMNGQFKVVFVEEGTFVPSVKDLNDTVVRFMMPKNLWTTVNIEPPRVNSKFHFYLVEQDRLPATRTATNQLAEKTCVLVAIRQAVLGKDSLTHIKNLARLTTSQYLSRSSKKPDLQSISWQNSISKEPIACGVMKVESLSFNPFTRIGRLKSDELWKEVSPSFLSDNSTDKPQTRATTTEQQHNNKFCTSNSTLPADFKPLAASTPLMEKQFFDTDFDSYHIEPCLLISKLVYVIPRIRQSNKNKLCSETKKHQTTTEEDIKFENPEVPHIPDPSLIPISIYGNNFRENQVVEIPFETYVDLTTSIKRECHETDLENTVLEKRLKN